MGIATKTANGKQKVPKRWHSPTNETTTGAQQRNYFAQPLFWKKKQPMG
jgi:hypothetical protein